MKYVYHFAAMIDTSRKELSVHGLHETDSKIDADKYGELCSEIKNKYTKEIGAKVVITSLSLLHEVGDCGAVDFCGSSLDITSVCPVPSVHTEWVKLWDQPDPNAFAWDLAEKEVFLSEAEFNGLREYSRSNPSGVYPGKMWKARISDGQWILHFFGFSYKAGTNEINEKKCSYNTYKLIVIKKTNEREL